MKRFGVLITIALCATISVVAQSQGRGRRAQLDELLPRLAERAALYEQTALRFACEEEVTLTRFKKEGLIRKQDHVVHDYLLEYTKRRGLQPYRAILSRNGSPTRRHKVEPEYGTPDPYGWQLLFAASGKGRFEFELIDQEFLDPHDTWVIEFTALASYATGDRIEEWEGTVWIDQAALDILQVRARPSKEIDTLEARVAEHREAFRFMGLSTKKRPQAHFLEVEFDIQREGLRFPSRSLYSVRLAVSAENMRDESSIVQRFRDYVFFDVESLDEFKALQAPE